MGDVLRFGGFSAVRSLDPARTFPSGVTGGTELAALYGLLVRFDPHTGEVEPLLARALTASADGLTWTLVLRDGVKFGDGSPLTAAAVRASIHRYNELGGQNSQLWLSRVAAVEAPDAEAPEAGAPGVVLFRLRSPWRDFPALLALGHGMIVGPGADADGGFAPVGAGAFTVAEFVPAQSLSLTARQGIALAGVEFTTGPEARRRADFARGALDAAVFREPGATTSGPAEPGASVYRETQELGGVVLINNRAGRPGADVRVRRALALALDPAALGYATGSDGRRGVGHWGGRHDPAAAARALAPALEDGYDGVIRLWSLRPAAEGDRGSTIRDLLREAGFTVEVGYLDSVADVVRRVRVEHDFDLAVSGLSLFEHAPSIRLHTALHSDSDTNTLGYRDSDMDGLLERLCEASTREAAQATLAEIGSRVGERAPFAALGSQTTLVTVSGGVRGVRVSLDSILLLDQASVNRNFAENRPIS